MMINKLYILLSLSIFTWHLAIAEDESKFIVTCPIIQTCKPSDGPKKNKSMAKDNLEAYDCYRFSGQAELAQEAVTAATKCQAIYGATTATMLDFDPKNDKKSLNSTH